MTVLRQVFRGKVVAGLRAAFRARRLSFPGGLQALAPESASAPGSDRCIANVGGSAKPPFGSPAHVLHYLARYTHRVAISNHRLVAVTDETVTFRWKDYRHGSQVRTLTLDVDDFLRRFSLHVLPKRFVRIRYFGLLAPRCRPADFATCRAARGGAAATARAVATITWSWPCPGCGAPMRIVERFTARQLFVAALLAEILNDSS